MRDIAVLSFFEELLKKAGLGLQTKKMQFFKTKGWKEAAETATVSMQGMTCRYILYKKQYKIDLL